MLPYTKREYDLMNIDDREATSQRQHDWIHHDLTRIPSAEGYRRAPWYRGTVTVNQFGEPAVPIFYECRHYDPDANVCLDYDNRPDTCRGYPRYELALTHPATALAPSCGYQADLGQPVEIRPKDQWA